MNPSDILSAVGVIISVLTLITGSLGRFEPYKREILAVGWFALGLAAGRLLYPWVGMSADSGAPPGIGTLIFIGIMALLGWIVVQNVRLGDGEAVLVAVGAMVILLFGYALATNVGARQDYTDDEILSLVAISEQKGDYARAIDLLKTIHSRYIASDKNSAAIIERRISGLEAQQRNRLTVPAN